MTHDAFHSAVQRHQRKVFTFARYLLSNREEAEDVTQEVLVRLWNNLDTVSPDRLGGWLLRVTRNLCYDRMRSRRSVGRFLCDATSDGIPADVPSRQPDPEILAGASQIGRRIIECIGRLKEPQRSAIILREIQGLSYRDIATALDLTESTVRITLYRARRSLRQHLQEVRHGAVSA